MNECHGFLIMIINGETNKFKFQVVGLITQESKLKKLK